jgi:hypothetical protein
VLEERIMAIPDSEHQNTPEENTFDLENNLGLIVK